MNYKEAREYIKKASQYGIVPGLDNISNLCDKLGNPQNELDVIHIAGTNGKGSVGAFAEQILIESGKKVGRYVSPSVFDYLEQFRINAENMSEDRYAYYISRISEVADKMTPHPTPFEMETAAAFLYFKEEQCDVVLIEVGMGGREDATNIIPKSLVSVITPISMDHMKFLGNTLEEIAYQKSGIIKNNGLVVTTKQENCVMNVIENECCEKNARLIKADNVTEYEISLDGEYQRGNAAVAEEVCRHIDGVSENDIKNGLINTVWHGRFEKICDKPEFIIDGAHNTDGAKRLKESIGKYYGNRKIVYITGVFADKAYKQIAEITAPLAQKIYTITPNNPRALSNEKYASAISEYNQNVEAVSLDTALKLCLNMTDCVVIAFGSLSFLGELKRKTDDIISMRKCNNILKNKNFRDILSKINSAEKDRIYCNHGIDHLLDVARSAYILNLENGLNIPKEIIYGTALLHDIGRYEQYKNGINHHKAGGEIAKKILCECGFASDEIEYMVEAVRAHREIPEKAETLGDIIAIADKRTRLCMMCNAIDTCKWSENEKNTDIVL